MEINNHFEAPASPDAVWEFMLDPERVIPCMPGATLLEIVDENNWKGKVEIKLGPVRLNYRGKVVVQERDDEAKKVVLKGQGMEGSGKGMVSATVTSKLQPIPSGTRVDIVTDLKISGAAAQYGRGMIGDVSERFTAEFAAALAHQLRATEAAGAGSGEAPLPPPPVKPISGLSIGLWALWRAVRRFFARLFGGAPASGGSDGKSGTAGDGE